LGQGSLLPVDLSIGLVCESILGRGKVPSIDEGPVAMVGEVVLVKEEEDTSALFVGNPGDVKYSGSGVVGKVCEGGCLMGEIVK
jgi:hypothetical protein